MLEPIAGGCRAACGLELAAQARCSRPPWLVTILREGVEVLGVVCATWAGLPIRRHGFVSTGRTRWAGILHVQSPGTSAVPGWWAPMRCPLGTCCTSTSDRCGGRLGFGLRGVLLRHLTQPELPALAGRPRLVRSTDALGVIHTGAWCTRGEWLAALSKNRRKNVRKISRMVGDDPTIDVITGPGAGADPIAVAALLRHNERKYPRLLAPLPQHTRYLTELVRQPDVVTIRYRDRPSGTLLAIVTILDHATHPIARHWSAIPADQGGRRYLYFHCYDVAVTWAIQSGKPDLAIGKGKPEFKQTMGATLIPHFAAAIPTF